MSIKSLQRKLDKVLAKAKAVQAGRCPQCGGSEWIKVGIPGMWDYECECCGHMQPYSPYVHNKGESEVNG
jgi:hypothetical protein